MPRKSSNIKKSDQNKGWNQRTQQSKLPLESRERTQTFLIVCEGQTEEWYFRSFPVRTATVTSKGVGMAHYDLIKKARALMKDETYDEVWCVFDMDFNPDRNGQIESFNNAVFAEDGKKFRCAYSNDAFELWFYLHYNYLENAHLRTFYYEQLSSYWDMNYVREGKTQTFSKTIYQKLQQDERANQQQAIERAKKLFEKNIIYSAPHERNPMTTVFELVEKLNAHF